ncbi:MAG: M23 family metallopeptidase [Anaerolineaceae bacterium]
MAKKYLLIFGFVLLAGLIILGTIWVKTHFGGRNRMVLDFLLHPDEHRDWIIPARSRCGEAPFIMPTEGFIGYLYDDRFKLFTPHQGLDFFGGQKAGLTPVYAPYDALLTRQSNWKSTLILRVPEDPLYTEGPRQIWLYMTHLADAQGESLILPTFPPGSVDIPVKQGDLLGYQGNYSGNPAQPVGVHLHFSIVKDDGEGQYLNELQIKNTIDPSKYFGLNLNAKSAGMGIPLCPEQSN